jgi:hypothetical protein
MAQLVECLSGKHESLSFNPMTTKRKKEGIIAEKTNLLTTTTNPKPKENT